MIEHSQANGCVCWWAAEAQSELARMENATLTQTLLACTTTANDRNEGRQVGRSTTCSYHVEVWQAAADGPEYWARLHRLHLQAQKEKINIRTARCLRLQLLLKIYTHISKTLMSFTYHCIKCWWVLADAGRRTDCVERPATADSSAF